MSLAQDIEQEVWWDFEDYSDPDICKYYLLGTLYWTTKAGNRIKVSDMTDSHISNCLQIPSFPNKENWDVIFKYELSKRLALTFKE